MLDANKTIPVGTYKGHEIVLDKAAHRFVAKGPLFEKERGYRCWDDAIEDIDKAEKVDFKAKRADLKLDVLTHTGEAAIIKGIHARLGTLLFTDGELTKRATETYGGGVVAYPNVSWVKERLDRLTVIQAEGERIKRSLRGYDISPGRTFGNMSPEQFDAAIEQLKKDHHEKTEKAINLGSGASEQDLPARKE